MTIFVRASNPSKDTYSYENQLTEALPAGTNSLKVLTDRQPSRFIMIGEPNNRQTEIVDVKGYNNFNVYTTQLVKHNHTQATNIYTILYNQVFFYKTENGVKTLVATKDIQFDQPDTKIQLPGTDNKDITYTYEYYSQENANKSGEKTAIVGDEQGFTFNSNATSFPELRRRFNQKVFRDPNSQELSDSMILLYFNETLDEINNKVISIYDDEYYPCYVDIAVLSGKSNYLLPENFYSALDVRINGCTIARRSVTRHRQECIYCKIEPEEVQFDDCGCEIKKPEPCGEPDLSCIPKPIQYYQITRNGIVLDPIPEEDATLNFTYSGLPTRFSLESKGIYLPPGYDELLDLGAMYRYFRTTNKTPDEIQYSQLIKKDFFDLLQDLTETISRRAIARKPNETQIIKGVRARHSQKPSMRYNFGGYGYNSRIFY